MSEKITMEEAFKAMFVFLDNYYDRSGGGELADVLSDIQILKDGRPADPAQWNDWIIAVNSAKSN